MDSLNDAYLIVNIFATLAWIIDRFRTKSETNPKDSTLRTTRMWSRAQKIGLTISALLFLGCFALVVMDISYIGYCLSSIFQETTKRNMERNRLLKESLKFGVFAIVNASYFIWVLSQPKRGKHYYEFQE